MIRYRLKELVADRSFKLGRAVTISEVAEATGITRRVLSDIANKRGYNTGVENIDRLCRYFGCHVADVMEYVDDAAVKALAAK